MRLGLLPIKGCPLFEFGLWHCASGSYCTPTEDHALSGNSNAKATFNRQGFTNVVKRIMESASSDAAVPVVLGDTTIKGRAELELALEEAGITGFTFVGEIDDFIWSTAELTNMISQPRSDSRLRMSPLWPSSRR